MPLSVPSGLLGVGGAGFLLMPTLILVGFETRKAAAIKAVAATPPTFSALLPHLSTAQWDGCLTLTLLAVGAFAGACLTSLYVPGQRIKQLFSVLIVVMTAYKIV
ncbi:TSUP family transporter [Streptomyces exfoliatus]|uniref:TSUP family transporter n=1 Tax=Streptomyces exfoliatus TaxID=1905 RepID=UPI000463AFA6